MGALIRMWEEAATVDFLGVRVYAFGLYAALGAALGLTVLALLLRRFRREKGMAPLTGALSIACGFIMSRLFFGWLDNSLGAPLSLRGMLMVTGGGYSMMGALLGACLGAVLAARIRKQNAARLLDFLAPALLFFVACERLGEHCIEGFGISRFLEGELLKGSFLAVEGLYESYLATYLLEAFTALILALALLRDENATRRPGDTFLLFLLLFGGTQVLMESLRSDFHMLWPYNHFVRYQQLIAFMLLTAGIITLAVRRFRKRRGLTLAALIALAVSLGVCVWLEFALDRTAVNKYLIYAVYIVALGLPVCLGVLLRREEKA